MKLLIVFLITLSGFIACNKRDKKQPVILPETKMERVIWDIMLADEFANVYLSQDSLKNLNTERRLLYLKIFQLHKISKDDFNASLKYYASKPDVMKVIFDSVSSKGELQRRKLIPLK